MKKNVSFILASLLTFSFVFASASAQENKQMTKNSFTIDKSIVDMSKTRPLEDIYLRDPCVLNYGGYYFMYGTGAATCAGYGCYVSTDLKNWAGPVNVYCFPSGSDADNCIWAPECYYYNGMFYLFATYHSSVTQHRGVSVFRAESPLGPFEEISDGHITSHNIDAIDGTLYVDENGTPWMAYVREWTATEDGVGRMAIAQMSDDLSSFVSEPKDIFKATDPIWHGGKITDGPYLYKTKSGKLLMIWSNGDRDGYCVGIAESKNGKIDGEWKQQWQTLYSESKSDVSLDGGHGMIFTDNDGRLLLNIHSPNNSTEEHPTRAKFYELLDTGDTLVLKYRYEKHQGILGRITYFFECLKDMVLILSDRIKEIF